MAVYCPPGYPRGAVIARMVLLMTLCLALAPAASALAQSSPFAPIPEAPPQQAPPAPAEDDDGQDGLSDTQQLLIALAGIVLLGGIAAAIIRDARRSAPGPVAGGTALDGDGRPVKGSRTPPRRRVKQNRAKAKTARQARKRNR